MSTLRAFVSGAAERSPAFWTWATGIVALLILALFALFHGLNFTHWDNTETFLPAIWYAHSQLLRGHFPFWNPLQNLGEPLHALGIGGALYPPYTIAVAITKLIGWPKAYALDLASIAHIVFGAIGLARLLIEFRVRGSIAFIAALSALFSGYALLVGGLWVHTIPNIAWSIWAMWGLRRVITEEKARSGAMVAAIALGIVFMTGHVQMAVNVWLSVWVWALLLAIALRVPKQRFLTLCVLAIAGALIALPALLPTALILGEASRMAQEEVLTGLGFQPLSLLGTLIPTLGLDDGALIHTVLINTFAGAWVVPGVILGASVYGRKNSEEDATIAGAFLASLGAALVFIWLNFGPPATLYSVLHSLPVLSDFRNPFKYWERVVPLLVTAGALGLELAARRRPGWIARVLIAALLLMAAIAWFLYPANEPLMWLSGSCALLVLLALVIFPPQRALQLIVPLTVFQCVGVLAIAQSSHRSKPYTQDRPESARLAIPDDHRVLPLSGGPMNHPYTRPLSLFYAASLDGYESASGHRFALTSRRLTDYINADITGRPFRGPQFERLLRSNWLRLADVGHFVVEQGDTFAFNAVKRRFPQATESITKQATTFHIDPGWPRAHFATLQVAFDSSTVKEVLFGESSITAASVEGDARARTLPPARVDSLQRGANRIRALVNTPQGGLLIFSTSYSSEWSARADRERVRVVPVNGMFAGVWVPPGAREVTLSVRRWPLVVGLLGAALGLALAWIVARKDSHARLRE